MRSYCALYVDVGYLLAAAATRVTGTSLRNGVVVSYPDLVARLIADAEKASGLPLLRLHWYDSGNRPAGTPDSTQEAIGMLPRVKLRLGRTSPQGEQKGVDLRIGLDLAAHGRNRSVDVIYLLSGDDDLSEAVEEAQSHGMQVVLMAVPDRAGKPHAVSRHLIRESDDLIVLDGVGHRRDRARAAAAARDGGRPVSGGRWGRGPAPGPARDHGRAVGGCGGREHAASGRGGATPSHPRRARRQQGPPAAGRRCRSAGPARVVERQRQRRQR